MAAARWRRPRRPRLPAPTELPTIEIVAPHRAQTPKRPRTRTPTIARRQTPVASPKTETQIVAEKNEKFDEARRIIVAPNGTGSYQFTHQAIEALPGGTNTTLDKVLLQAPGVTQDSAASGELHVRNEHANLQYRINGIMLPDGVGAFGQFLDTGIVGKLDLITGALPAQYGLRTAGVVDIQTKNDAFNNTGSISLYGGSHGTVTPSFEYGGTVGQTQYFVSGRYFGSMLGLENPTPANEAIHDRTSQEKGFLYLSTVLDPTSRLTFMSGVSNATYQIPNNPGQPPQLHRLRGIQLQFLDAQRAAIRIQPVQCPCLPEIDRGYRLPDLLFQPLQPVALQARSARRPRHQWRGL